MKPNKDFTWDMFSIIHALELISKKKGKEADVIRLMEYCASGFAKFKAILCMPRTKQ